jgi:hypothetical protein
MNLEVSSPVFILVAEVHASTFPMSRRKVDRDKE